MQLTMKQRGIITLLGGFVIELVTGTVFLWGQLNVYITSYYRQKDDNGLELSVGGAIFPVMMASLATGIPLGLKGIKYFGSARVSCIISSIIAAVMVFVASYTQKFWQFIIVYGIIFGVAQGSIYFVPIYMGYLYFPNNKGMVSGIVTGGFALCSFIFGLIFFAIVNPNGMSQVKNSDGYSYFEGGSVSVAQNVPDTLRKMSYMYLGVAVFAAFFLLYHPNQIGEEEKRLKLQLKQKEAEKKLVEENIVKVHLQQLVEEQQKMTDNHEENQHNNSHLPHQRIRKSIQILTHTLEVVHLEQHAIQKKIGIAQQNDDNASYNALFPSSSTQQQPKEESLHQKADSNNIHQIQNQQSPLPVNLNGIQMTNLYNQKKSSIEVNEQQEEQNHNLPTESNVQLNVYVENGGIIELNQRILNIIQTDTAENKRQHTNKMIEENNLQTLNNDNVEEELSKINEDVLQKEKQVKEELESIQNREEEIIRLNKLGAPTVTIALKQPQLYMSILLGILALGFGVLINGNYKSIAKDYGFTSDSYQALVGSMGGVANGLSRPMWSTLLDKFTFKQIISTILCIEIVCVFTMRLTDSSEVFFIIWVFIIHMTMGAVLGMWPVLSAQLNGVKVGSQLFGLYWYGFSIATLLQFFLVLGLKTTIGFNNLYYIYAAQAIFALIIVQVYTFKVNWSKYYITEQKKIEIPTQTDTEQKQLQSDK